MKEKILNLIIEDRAEYDNRNTWLLSFLIGETVNDPEEALRSAVKDFITSDTSVARDALESANGCFNWGDVKARVPDEYFVKRGLTPLSDNSDEVVVDHDEVLRESDTLFEVIVTLTSQDRPEERPSVIRELEYTIASARTNLFDNILTSLYNLGKPPGIYRLAAVVIVLEGYGQNYSYLTEIRYIRESWGSIIAYTKPRTETCLNCGKETTGEVYYDELGPHLVCQHCEASFDVPYDECHLGK